MEEEGEEEEDKDEELRKATTLREGGAGVS